MDAENIRGKVDGGTFQQKDQADTNWAIGEIYP